MPVPITKALALLFAIGSMSKAEIQFVLYHDFGLLPQHAELEARLVHAEVNVMQGAGYWDASLSVLDTYHYWLAKGAFGETPEQVLGYSFSTGYYAFPPWVVYGCENLLDSRCHDGEDITRAMRQVAYYYYGLRGRCSGYQNYHSMQGGPVECLVESGPWYVAYHNGWKGQPATTRASGSIDAADP